MLAVILTTSGILDKSLIFPVLQLPFACIRDDSNGIYGTVQYYRAVVRKK